MILQVFSSVAPVPKATLQRTSPVFRLVHITTVPITLGFLAGQAKYMAGNGFEVHFVSSPGPMLIEHAQREGACAHAIPMQRAISPAHDLVALWCLYSLFRRLRPAVVHAHTPKAGLLSMLAAFLARVPVRIYHVHGLPEMTAKGLKRRALHWSERLAARFSSAQLAVGESVRAAAIAFGPERAAKLHVLLDGTINGIDCEKFDPGIIPIRRDLIRQKFGIPTDAIVIGFVGRLAIDKGVRELADAWRSLSSEFDNVHLILAGWRDGMPKAVELYLEHAPRVHILGAVSDTPSLYSAIDIVALPTYREGFPYVPLEAAAMGLPVVATRVCGCVDAVVEGVTGLLVEPHSADELVAALRTYLRDPLLRHQHGMAGRERVTAKFAPLPLWQAIRAEYARLLSAAREDESWAESTKPLQAVRNKALIWQRVFDISVSLLGLLLLAPVIAIVALAIRINMGAPVIFRQSRPGRDGTLFQILKFRTMSDRRDEQRLLPDEQRLGWFGKFLRSTSLDELPELWNVLRGEMNLVGPRPLLVQYLPLYTARQSRRHEVKPGITGWAQVNGRNALTWERKFELDVWYVDHWSVWLDLKIICITVVKVLRRDGISQRGHATIAEFMGSTHITGQHE